MGMPSYANANNQFQSGVKYDAAGNVAYDGINNYQYDEESRVASTAFGASSKAAMYYLYNGDGERVAKLNATDEATLNGPVGQTCPGIWVPSPIGGPAPFQPPIFTANTALIPSTTATGTATWITAPVGGPAPYQPGPFLREQTTSWAA